MEIIFCSSSLRGMEEVSSSLSDTCKSESDIEDGAFEQGFRDKGCDFCIYSYLKEKPDCREEASVCILSYEQGAFATCLQREISVHKYICIDKQNIITLFPFCPSGKLSYSNVFQWSSVFSC